MFIIAWIVSAFLAVIVADSRGHATAGYWLGLLLGPLGLLLTLFLPQRAANDA